jgi:hypothetical protein
MPQSVSRARVCAGAQEAGMRKPNWLFALMTVALAWLPGFMLLPQALIVVRAPVCLLIIPGWFLVVLR